MPKRDTQLECIHFTSIDISKLKNPNEHTETQRSITPEKPVGYPDTLSQRIMVVPDKLTTVQGENPLHMVSSHKQTQIFS